MQTHLDRISSRDVARMTGYHREMQKFYKMALPSYSSTIDLSLNWIARVRGWDHICQSWMAQRALFCSLFTVVLGYFLVTGYY